MSIAPGEKLRLADEEATMALGARLGSLAAGMAGERALVIALDGPLGAGKTTLVRGLLRSLGVRGAIRSPTFTLVETYGCGDLEIVHLDLYRIDDAAAIAGLGLRDYHRARTIWLIEWPQRGEGYLPQADLQVQLASDEAGGRDAWLKPASAAGRRLVEPEDAPDSCEAD